MARLSVMAPIVIGAVAAFGLRPKSNIGKAFFIILTYTSMLFDRMIMSGAASILTRGIVDEQTGIKIFWSQWLLAYLPAVFFTVIASWSIVHRLYHAEKNAAPGRSTRRKGFESIISALALSKSTAHCLNVASFVSVSERKGFREVSSSGRRFWEVAKTAAVSRSA
jgi:hypothetical protein